MSTPKVSIVIPIYNPGERLRICLESLLNQSFKDIEIVCILDCPTDNSAQILKSYANNDNRIILFENKENLHIGLSRNKGLEHSRGEYVMFFDDDDYCESNMIELLYNEAVRKNRPVAGCNRDYVSVDGEVIVDYKVAHKVENNTCDYLLKAIILRDGLCNANGIWTKLFNRDFLVRHNILFVDTKIISAEDSLFNFQVFLALKEEQTDLAFVNATLYHHVDHLHNTAKTDSYEIGLMKYREQLISLARKHELNMFDFELYLGNVAQLYTMFKKVVLKNRLSKNQFFSLLYDCPKIIDTIMKYHKFYTSNLTIPKNIFSNFLYRKLKSYKQEETMFKS